MLGVNGKLLVERIRLAADWFVNSQCRMERPYWDANHGRFVYDRHRLTGKTVWGLSWTQARGIMVLLAAHQLEPDERYVESANSAAQYIEMLQAQDARLVDEFGAIREEVPQRAHYAVRDQAEAASGMLYLGAYMGKQRLIDNTRLWAEWFLKYAVSPETGWPKLRRRPDGTWGLSEVYFLAAIGLVLYHLGAYLDEQRYIEQGLTRLTEYALAHCFGTDGALHTAGHLRHHGNTTGLVFNEDGAVIALMAAERVTGKSKFKDAALRHLDRVMAEPLPLPISAGLPNTMMVAAEAARIYDYEPAEKYCEKNLEALLQLQITDASDKDCGAFIGEDEDTKWYSGGDRSDYVTTRCTAYGALALAKMEGRAVTGGYSTDAALPVRSKT